MSIKSPTTIDLQDIAKVGIFTSAGEVNREVTLASPDLVYWIEAELIVI